MRDSWCTQRIKMREIERDRRELERDTERAGKLGRGVRHRDIQAKTEKLSQEVTKRSRETDGKENISLTLWGK